MFSSRLIPNRKRDTFTPYQHDLFQLIGGRSIWNAQRQPCRSLNTPLAGLHTEPYRVRQKVAFRCYLSNRLRFQFEILHIILVKPFTSNC